MPIVFWASFEPWLKAMYAAEMTWSRRNRSLRSAWVGAPEHVQEHDHQAEADEHAEDRRRDQREEDLVEDALAVERRRRRRRRSPRR